MQNIKSKWTLGTLVCVGALAVSSAAHSASYRLHQGGFSDGGEITLTFEGIDSSNDGLIDSSSSGEVTQAFLTYTGSSKVPDFASWLASANQLFLTFKVGENGFGNDDAQGIYINVPTGDREAEGKLFMSYAGGALSGGAGFVGFVNPREHSFGVGATSSLPITISQVPEPGTLLSMALGLATLVVFGRRQSS